MIRASSSGGRRDSPRLAQRCHARLVNASQARLSRGWLWSLVVAGVLVQTALNLLRPIYSLTNQYGHFGRKKGDKNFKVFTWEQTDKAAALVKALAK